ncbi:hypothetical protein AVEN_142569-1 [Araneus ventricosus]|uniref:Uncharacterized protein n=1 Tax=Araneus ventricosus TaxID=182803 RepID=A0A4Y2CG03_ARAVE|nr:hypothetical protein AVEN_142569-1 [Araneus ventricosus]
MFLSRQHKVKLKPINQDTSKHNIQLSSFLIAKKSQMRKSRRNEKWTEVLSTILLGFRAAIKADSNVSSVELVYGTTLRQPGEFFDEHSVIKSPEEIVKKLSNMFHNFTPVPTKSHHIVKPFVVQGLETSAMVYEKDYSHLTMDLMQL